jgi:hypothetical protein
LGNKPSRVTQREIQQIVRGARKAGAGQVQVNLPSGASIVIPLVPNDDKPVKADEEITL